MRSGRLHTDVASPAATSSIHTRSKLATAAVTDAGRATKAIVKATPNVPPNWRRAWLAAPPTPSRFGGRAWAMTLDSWGRAERDAEPGQSSIDGRIADQVGRGGADHDQPPQAAGREHQPPAISSGRWPTRPARRPNRGARRATTTGPGLTAEAGADDRLAPHLVRSRNEPKNMAVNPVPKTKVRGVDPGVVADGEQREVERRRRRPALMGDEERRTAPGRRSDGAEGVRRRPAPVVALHHRRGR